MSYLSQKIINPTKDQVNIQMIKTLCQQCIQEEKFRKPLLAPNLKFSEENFLQTKLQSYSQNDKECYFLNTYREKAKQNIKALMIFNHGMNLHMNRMSLIADHFSNHGIECVGFDFKGFGKSDGEKGWIGEDLEHYEQDNLKFLKELDSIYDQKIPRFFIGFSMGGLVGFNLATKYPDKFKGIILLAPAIQEDFDCMKYSKYLLRYFADWVLPYTPLVKNEGRNASKNPGYSEDFQKDPLTFHHYAKPRSLTTMLNEMGKASSSFSKLTTPFMIIQGGLDKLACCEGAFNLYEQSPSEDKQLIFFNDAWHDVINEVFYEWIDDCTSWILKKL